MEPRPGLEPGTSSLPWMRYYQLSYRGVKSIVKMVLEVGLALSKTKSDVLLFDAFLQKMVLEVGLEPTKREAREIYSLLSLPLDDSSNLFYYTKIRGKSQVIFYCFWLYRNRFSCILSYQNRGSSRKYKAGRRSLQRSLLHVRKISTTELSTKSSPRLSQLNQ